MTSTAIPKSRNPRWGFCGTMTADTRCPDTGAAWDIAMRSIAAATRSEDRMDAVRDFLDSRQGRHLADKVSNALLAGMDLTTAIARSVQHANTARIGRATSTETGIPQDLPWLTGWVHHHAILAEDTAETA